MVHPRHGKSRPPSRLRTLFANLARAFEIQARMIIASVRAASKSGLEAMLRFGLRSNDIVTIMERFPEPSPGIRSRRADLRDGADLKPAALPQPLSDPVRPRLPKRFLAARHADG